MSKYRIFVAEDDSEALSLIKVALENIDCAVVGVESVQRAKQLVCEMAFDAYVVDLGLSDGSALPVLQSITTANKENRDKIVVHTSFSHCAVESLPVQNISRCIIYKSASSIEDLVYEVQHTVGENSLYRLPGSRA